MRRFRPATLIGFLLLAALAAGTAGLTACSAKPRETSVKFVGRAPYGVFYADTRAVVEACPACSKDVGRADEKCTSCSARLKHAERVACGFCRGSKKCDPCAAFETAGRCRFCGGSGRLSDAACFNCAGSGVCAACGGAADCDACGGSGTIALPWTKSKPVARPVVAVGRPGVKPDRFVAWPGETVALPNAMPRFTIRGDGTTPGAYVATSLDAKLYFDRIEFSARLAGPAVVASGTPIQAVAETTPAVRGEFVKWDFSQGGEVRATIPGASLGAPAPGKGRWTITPIVEIPGLPAHRAARPLEVDVFDFRIVAPSAALAAGATVEFRALADPPMPAPSAYEWTIDAPGGPSTLKTNDAVVRVPLARPGRHRVVVRCGAFASSPLEISAFGVEAVDPSGQPTKEAGLALFEDAFDERGALRPDWLDRARERVCIRVTDTDPAAPAVVSVSVLRADGSAIQSPIALPISKGVAGPIVLVGDAADDALGDATVRAEPGSRVEISYRGAVAATLAVGPASAVEIPVRFVAVGLEGMTPDALKRAAERRLDQANAVWGRFGLRFIRASAEIAEPPKNLLLISGRAAGVDERGRRARAALRVNGVEISVETAWTGDEGPMTPDVTARGLQRLLERDWQVDRIEKIFSRDPDAIVARLRPRRGGGAAVDVPPEGRDLAQTLTPLRADLSDGCEVSPHAGVLSLDELGLLLGLKGDGLDVLIVGDVRSAADRPAFKVYPEWAYPASVSGAAIAVLNIMDDSDRYPYGLARALGEVLLPTGPRPSVPHALFAEPLSEKPAADAQKRVDAQTGALVRAAARRWTAKF